MNKELIYFAILIIIILFLFNFKESFTTDDTMLKKYKTAYDLGINYIRIMSYHKFYNIKYPAVMFDIDDTLINYSGKPITPIIKLLKECNDLGLLIVIITARDSIYHDETVKELKKFDIPYEFLFLRRPHDGINTFKSAIKQYLAEKEDIIIVMSLGDNLIDVDGDYSGYFIKLPNRNDPNLYHLNADKKIEVVKV
jgi:predicted HAD superfamily phosphohydrolase YqeG